MTQEKTKSTTKERIKKRLASVAIFIMMALFLAYEEPTIEIAWVTAILLLTIYLFAFEIVDVDIAAVSIMVLLGLTSLFAPIMG
ncbi:MAG TPA: SLC13 family permease, partial [Gammaproteobacteria bacterium]|nr:SLC13 family permease [Gammaproteobacteria bacterium]